MDNRAFSGRALLVCAIAFAACSAEGERSRQEASPKFSSPAPALDLAARAARGLEISPVPIDLGGLDDAGRLKVGIGSYIVNALATCAGCHGAPPAFLAGGTPFDLGGGQIVFSRNLTPDADTGLKLNEWQFLNVLRTGRDYRGNHEKMLIVMPWLYLRWMSEGDIHAVYAYLRRIPGVHNAVPPDVKDALPVPPEIPFPGFYDDGQVDRPLVFNGDYFPPARGLAISPLAEPSGLSGRTDASFGTGSYIVNAVTRCSECHTRPERTADQSKLDVANWLTGGGVFEVPPPLAPILHQTRTMSANLKGATHGFFSEPGESYDLFHAILTTGTHVDETPPRPLGFPMNEVAAGLALAIDADLQGIHEYLTRTPATTGASDVQRQPPAVWCATNADCGTGTCAPSHECVGQACTADTDCGACQTCGGGKCQAPAADSACVNGP